MRELAPSPAAGEAEDWTGRLWDLPLVWLRPLRVPVERLRHSAPEWLHERARARSGPLRQRVLELLRDPARVGTAVVAQVPVWLPRRQVGYVLDFLFPEYGVNLQIDSWAEVEARTGDPDHAWNLERDEDLRGAHGIETLHYWDVAVAEVLDRFPEEVRMELGIGRPRWLRKFG
jgi:hypothetical protein